MNKKKDIKNLSQLKRVLKPGARFMFVSGLLSDYVGQPWEVTARNSTGFYAVPVRQKQRFSRSNGGRGLWFGWSNAPFWKFENGTCSVYYEKNKQAQTLIFSFCVME